MSSVLGETHLSHCCQAGAARDTEMSVYQQSPLVDAWAGGISEILVAESDDADEDKSS